MNNPWKNRILVRIIKWSSWKYIEQHKVIKVANFTRLPRLSIFSVFKLLLTILNKLLFFYWFTCILLKHFEYSFYIFWLIKGNKIWSAIVCKYLDSTIWNLIVSSLKYLFYFIKSNVSSFTFSFDNWIFSWTFDVLRFVWSSISIYLDNKLLIITIKTKARKVHTLSSNPLTIIFRWFCIIYLFNDSWYHIYYRFLLLN